MKKAFSVVAIAVAALTINILNNPEITTDDVPIELEDVSISIPEVTDQYYTFGDNSTATKIYFSSLLDTELHLRVSYIELSISETSGQIWDCYDDWGYEWYSHKDDSIDNYEDEHCVAVQNHTGKVYSASSNNIRQTLYETTITSENYLEVDLTKLFTLNTPQCSKYTNTIDVICSEYAKYDTIYSNTRIEYSTNGTSWNVLSSNSQENVTSKTYSNGQSYNTQLSEVRVENVITNVPILFTTITTPTQFISEQDIKITIDTDSLGDYEPTSITFKTLVGGEYVDSPYTINNYIVNEDVIEIYFHELEYKQSVTIDRIDIVIEENYPVTIEYKVEISNAGYYDYDTQVNHTVIKYEFIDESSGQTVEFLKDRQSYYLSITYTNVNSDFVFREISLGEGENETIYSYSENEVLVFQDENVVNLNILFVNEQSTGDVTHIINYILLYDTNEDYMRYDKIELNKQAAISVSSTIEEVIDVTFTTDKTQYYFDEQAVLTIEFNTELREGLIPTAVNISGYTYYTDKFEYVDNIITLYVSITSTLGYGERSFNLNYIEFIDELDVESEPLKRATELYVNYDVINPIDTVNLYITNFSAYNNAIHYKNNESINLSFELTENDFVLESFNIYLNGVISRTIKLDEITIIDNIVYFTYVIPTDIVGENTVSINDFKFSKIIQSYPHTKTITKENPNTRTFNFYDYKFNEKITVDVKNFNADRLYLDEELYLIFNVQDLEGLSIQSVYINSNLATIEQVDELGNYKVYFDTSKSQIIDVFDLLITFRYYERYSYDYEISVDSDVVIFSDDLDNNVQVTYGTSIDTDFVYINDSYNYVFTYYTSEKLELTSVTINGKNIEIDFKNDVSVSGNYYTVYIPLYADNTGTFTLTLEELNFILFINNDPYSTSKTVSNVVTQYEIYSELDNVVHDLNAEELGSFEEYVLNNVFLKIENSTFIRLFLYIVPTFAIVACSILFTRKVIFKSNKL